MLREALGLWRGAALADFAYEDFAQSEIARLEELRLGATEDRIDADLAIGRARQSSFPSSSSSCSAHPLRERLRGQLMLALYRSGRQAEALDVYRDGRSVLRDELGLEPGAALKELEQAILNQDPALGPPTRLPPSVQRKRLRRGALLVGVLVLLAGGLVVRSRRTGWGRDTDPRSQTLW